MSDPIDVLWDRVTGQPDAVAALRSAAAAPVHAYLLVGPRGAGKFDAALAFAAELLSDGLGPAERARVAHLVAERNHPSLSIVQREGASISADQAREVVRRSALAPPEGPRQVFLLDEFHLVRDAAPILLKSIEEPPPGTVFVVLAEDVPDELVTIASRCVNVSFPAVPREAIRSRLVEEGAPEEVAAAAADASGGDLRRARLLVSDPDLVSRRAAWAQVPVRLDGTGAVICALTDELLGGIEGVLEPLRTQQEAETAELVAVGEQLGEVRKGDLRRLEERHKREARRVRADELRGGLSSMMGTYRDHLVRTGRTEEFTAAGGLVQEFSENLTFNPNEALALRGLFARLPVLRAR